MLTSNMALVPIPVASLKTLDVDSYVLKLVMDAYGLYELHVKAKAREQTNNFFNTLKLYSAQKIGINCKP